MLCHNWVGKGKLDADKQKRGCVNVICFEIEKKKMNIRMYLEIRIQKACSLSRCLYFPRWLTKWVEESIGTMDFNYLPI